MHRFPRPLDLDTPRTPRSLRIDSGDSRSSCPRYPGYRIPLSLMTIDELVETLAMPDNPFRASAIAGKEKP
jgi:hypothetical protein